MTRREQANNCHKKGFNCCQSVLGAFCDVTGLDEKLAMNVASGFGSGAGTGELCGAVSGAVMVLSLVTPVDFADPVASKKRSVELAKALQERFSQRYGHLRCQDLLAEQDAGNGPEGGCGALIEGAVEIVEELLREKGILA